MLHALTATLQEALTDRLTLLVNHVLGSEAVATQRLRVHVGRTFGVQFDGWPALLPPLPRIAYRITPAGLLESVSPAGFSAEPDLKLTVDASNPALALLQWSASGEWPRVAVQGDAQFAADLSWLIDNLRWDVQDDVARFIGQAPAHELARVARLVAGGLRAALSGLGEALRPALVRRDAHHGEQARLPQPPGRPAWASEGDAMRHFTRLVFIVFTVLRYGLDELALSGFRQRWVRALVRVMTLGRRLDAPRGQRLRMALEQLGPIFVKFGQVLSTRRDLLPTDIADELARLQDRVPPFPPAQARQLVEQAFGKPIEALFQHFEAEPVASASIAQVHFAVLAGGREVAVKVLRPGMLEAIEDDLALLRTLARWVERLSADGKRLRPREVVAEFDNYLHDELDLVREAANAAHLRRNMQDLALIMVPEMVWELCTSSVIVMERMHGVPISQTQRLRDAGVDIKKLARDGVTIFFTQVFRDGFFHADMHPGNIQVSIAPATFGRYIALDFGIVGTLTESDKEYLAHNFIAFFRRDYKRVAELHVESGWVPATTRVEDLEGAIRAVCEPHFDRPLKDISLGNVLLRLFQTSRRFNVEIQPQLVLLQKTLLNVEGLGRQLDPDLDLWATAKPFLERWMNDQIGWAGFVERLKNEAPRYAQLLPELPRLIHQALQSAAHADSREVDKLLAEQRRTNRLLQGIVYGAIGIVLGALAMQAWMVRH